MVLSRATRQEHAPPPHENVPVGRAHEAEAGAQHVAIMCRQDGKRGPARKHVRKEARGTRRKVKRHDDGGRKIGRYFGQNLPHRLQRARRPAYDDNATELAHVVSATHVACPRSPG
jgi:hypothetical protein